MPVCARPAPHACDDRYTSRQRNTHSTESREVSYPWHPWFGRSVVVYDVRIKQGHSVCWCGLEEGRTRQSVEIPAWMFEPAACGRLRVLAVPSVGCDALLEFKALPPEIQEKTIRLLARLLRVHVDRGLASGQAQEAGNE